MNCQDCMCVRKGDDTDFEECLGYNKKMGAYVGCNRLCPQCRL